MARRGQRGRGGEEDDRLGRGYGQTDHRGGRGGRGGVRRWRIAMLKVRVRGPPDVLREGSGQ